jgi:hypothetical protein
MKFTHEAGARNEFIERKEATLRRMLSPESLPIGGPEAPGTGNCQQPFGSILRKMTSLSKRRHETMRQLP